MVDGPVASVAPYVFPGQLWGNARDLWVLTSHEVLSTAHPSQDVSSPPPKSDGTCGELGSHGSRD